MKKLFLVLLFPLVCIGQSKQWTGTSTLMWPSQSPSAVIIDKNGTNTLLVNNINATVEDATLLKMQQQGTNQIRIFQDGSVYHSYSFTSNPTSRGIHTPLLDHRNVSLGDYDGSEVWLKTIAPSMTSEFDLFISSSQSFHKLAMTGTNGYASLARLIIEPNFKSELGLQSSGGTSGGSSSVTIKAQDGTPELTIASTNNLVQFRPGSSASTVPVLFNTTITHTSSDLLRVQNSGTNHFNVTFDGKIQTVAPVSTAGAWRLGTVITNSAVTVITDSYVEISIGGQVLKLAIVQ